MGRQNLASDARGGGAIPNGLESERSMPPKNQVSDKSLLQSVQRKLLQKCAGSRIITTVRSGAATISGTIKNEHERKPIIRTINAVQGVSRVIDQLRVAERKQINFQPRPERTPEPQG
jgi:osmotically-inducible protein OsmY